MNTTIKRLTAKILFFILFMFFSALTHAAPQININNPSSDVSSQNTLEFDVSVVDSLPTYGFVDWDDSLVGWWRAEDNANDESRHANHGTFVGDTHIVDTGKYGKAFSFDGDGDSVDFGDKDAFDFHKTDSFTISVWVNPSTASGTILNKFCSFSLFYHNAKRWQFTLGHINNSKYVFSTEENPQNKWVHIAVTYNASNEELLMYINGKEDTDWTDTIGEFEDFSSAHPLKIGERLSGLIDEVMLFKRALSLDEIKALYEVTNGRFINTYNDLNEFTTYSYQFHAVNTNGERSNTERKEILVDVPDTPPRVVLDYPLPNTREDSPKQTFKCTVFNTNRNTQLQRVTFHWDYPGSFVADETKRVIGDTVSVEFVKTNLVGKTFEWNCSAVDTHNNSGFAPENFTYIVGRDEYHVAPNGDDNNPGTILLPFRTIQKAADIALPGDTIYIRGGIYRETVIPQSSGNAFAPITFKGYPTEEVVISGADPLTGGWTQHQGAIYKTTMDWDLGLGNNQIFVDGKVMMEARWPNADNVIKPTLFYIDEGNAEGTTGTITDSELTQAPGFWDGAVVHGAWSYTANTGIVSSYSAGTLNIDFPFPPGHTYNMPGAPYYITCSYNALDKEGEWFYDSSTSTLYLWAPNGTNPTTHTVEAKKREYAFDLRGKSYINIENLDIFASTIITDSESHHMMIDNITALYVSHFTMIDLSNLRKLGRNTGIILDGHDNIIQNSYIAYSAGNGVSLIGDDCTVHNCTIHDVNYVVTECGAIHTGGIDSGSYKTWNNRITHNKLYNAGRSIIIHNDAYNLKILYNEMYNNDCGNEVWDLGATYCIDTDGRGSEIAYNKIHDVVYIGIYFDHNCSNFNVHHNVIWDFRTENTRYPGLPNGIHMNTPSQGNKIYNNTMGNTWITINGSFEPSIMYGTEIKNNLGDWVKPPANFDAWGTLPPGLIYENNMNTRLSLGPPSVDPTLVYVDYEHKDYHLKSGSPAIDAGLDLGFTQDADGNSIVGAPDIGAYEFGSDPLKKDINKDGKVNIQDVQACVNHISGKQDWGSAADVNGDGNVNEADLQEIVNIILGE